MLSPIYMTRRRLKQEMEREATILERLTMRLKTMRDSVRMFFVSWKDVPSYLLGERLLILLAPYYVRSDIDMEMFSFDDSELVRKLVGEATLYRGLLVDHEMKYLYTSCSQHNTYTIMTYVERS